MIKDVNSENSFNNQSKNLRNLYEGDLVWARNFQRGEKWVEGKVVKITGLVTYLIEIGDFRTNKHIDQLRFRDSIDIFDKPHSDGDFNSIIINDCKINNDRLSLQNTCLQETPGIMHGTNVNETDANNMQPCNATPTSNMQPCNVTPTINDDHNKTLLTSKSYVDNISPTDTQLTENVRPTRIRKPPAYLNDYTT